jgi:ABC-type protease/lipase transport system, ATPase and permease components
MRDEITQRGLGELRAVRKCSRALYWTVALFSLFANLLMLTGPMYMLQVYDRVLGSGSEETLIALSILVGLSLRGDGGSGPHPGPHHGAGGRAVSGCLGPSRL